MFYSSLYLLARIIIISCAHGNDNSLAVVRRLQFCVKRDRHLRMRSAISPHLRSLIHSFIMTPARPGPMELNSRNNFNTVQKLLPDSQTLWTRPDRDCKQFPGYCCSRVSEMRRGEVIIMTGMHFRVGFWLLGDDECCISAGQEEEEVDRDRRT